MRTALPTRAVFWLFVCAGSGVPAVMVPGNSFPVPERVGAAYRCGRHDEQAVHTPMDLGRPSAGSVTALSAGLVVSFRSGQVHFELVPGRAALRHIDHSDGPPNALAPI